MNLGFGNLLRGLPGLIGVLAGIALYAKPLLGHMAVVPVVAVTVAYVFLRLARGLITSVPRVATFLVEFWVLCAVGIAALSTQFLLWLTVASPGWFNLDEPQVKALSGALVGAIAAYLATTWISDLKESEGPLLPRDQFRDLARRFATQYTVTGDNQVWDACHSEHVQNTDINGWDFGARWRRAAIMSRHSKGRPRP